MLANRVLTIAAAGGHDILLNGLPGTGKPILAHVLPSILLRVSAEEMLEDTYLHSLARGSCDRGTALKPYARSAMSDS